MARKDVYDEWKAGRAYWHGDVRTDGHDLWSYGLRIGTRNQFGHTIALKPYGVSHQRNKHMHCACLVAEITTFGIHDTREAWYEKRVFLTDADRIGDKVWLKVGGKSWARYTSALNNIDKYAKLSLYAGEELVVHQGFKRLGYASELKPIYEIWVVYTLEDIHLVNLHG